MAESPTDLLVASYDEIDKGSAIQAQIYLGRRTESSGPLAVGQVHRDLGRPGQVQAACGLQVGLGGIVGVVGDPAVEGRHQLGASSGGQKVSGQELLAGGVELKSPGMY